MSKNLIKLCVLLFWSCVCSAKLKSSSCEKSLMHSEDTAQIEILNKRAEEAQLKALGYNSGFTRGKDAMREWIVEGEWLREQEANGHTPIPYYAKILPQNIAYMEGGIANEAQWKNFERLKEYAHPLIDKEQVTYLDWLQINFYSVEVLSERKSDALRSAIYELADKFPSEIAVPTTISEPGIMAFNRGWGREIHPIGISSRWRPIHGSNRDPLSLAGHDVSHMREGRRIEPLLHERLMERVESLPVKKRKNVELGYNAVTRETFSKTFSIENPDDIRKNIKRTLKNFIFETKDGRGLIDISGGKEQAIQGVVDDFMEVFHEIQSSGL